MKLDKLLAREVRKFYFENKWKHKEVQEYLLNHHKTKVSIRTLKRWKKKLKNPKWQSTKPKPPVPKSNITVEEKERIIKFRKKTGWGSNKLKSIFNFDISESTYKRIIKKNDLSRGSKIENKRIHWVKWQRNHPDSLWQMDGSQLSNGNWILPIIDDCSRYDLGLKEFLTITTKDVTDFLEELFKIHGKPRELLTDNGSEFGGIWRDNSEFDKWCRKQGIEHIRSRVHKPTTAGKVERFHGTFQEDMKYCDGDYELFRFRYNHMRPHASLHMKTPAEVYFSIDIRINGIGFKQTRW